MGIGPVTPFDVGLQVDPTGRRQANMEASNPVVFGYDGVAASADVGRVFFDTASSVFALESTVIGAGTPRDMVLRTGAVATERVRIGVAGRVGIGRVADTFQLEVLTTLGVRQAGTGNINQISLDSSALQQTFRNTGGGGRTDIITSNAPSGLISSLNFQTAGEVGAFSFTRGIAAAGFEIRSVANNATGAAGLTANGGGATGFLVATSGAPTVGPVGVNIGTTGALPIVFRRSTTTETARFTGTGEFLINTVTVFGTEKFRVNGDARVDGKLTVTGVIDPTAVRLSDPAAGTSLFFESANGATAPVSAANEGRIRYNNATARWQVSTNGGAYADIATGTVPVNAFVQDGNSFGVLATLGTNDAFALAFETVGIERGRFDTAGRFGIGKTALVFDLDLSHTRVGSGVIASIENLDNTNAASFARVRVSSGGASAGDPNVNWSVVGIQDWVAGVDNSDGDKFKIASSSALETNTVVTIFTTGEFLVGTSATLFSGDKVSILADGNSLQRLSCKNANAGASAVFQIGISNNSNIGLGINVTSSTATFGVAGPNSVMLRTDTSIVDFILNAFGVAPIRIFTNNIERARFLSTGEFLVGRTVLVAAADIANFEKNQNGQTRVVCQNTTDGTAAFASLIAIRHDTNNVSIICTAASFTATLGREANAGILDSGVGRIIINSRGGDILFKTGGSFLERSRFTTAGEFLVGRATLFSADSLADFDRAQNSATVLRLINGSSGTAARAVIAAHNDATGSTSIQTFSTGFTPTGLRVANGGLVTMFGGVSLTLGTEAAIPLVLGTNSTERARFLSTGLFGINTSTPTSRLHVAGSLALPTKTITVADSPYTMLESDFNLLVDASGGAVTVVLPAVAGIPNRIYNVKKIDASANTVTVDPAGVETIDGALTLPIGSQYESRMIQNDGTTWWII